VAIQGVSQQGTEPQDAGLVDPQVRGVEAHTGTVRHRSYELEPTDSPITTH
jgi:hypothetical protein